MKPLYLLIAVLNTGVLAATAQDTLYYDISWHLTVAQKASYYRTRTRTPPGCTVVDHWLNGKVQMTGAYADDSFHVRTGEFVWYDSTGNPTHRCVYKEDKLNGPETYYYPNGQIRMTGTEANDKFEGDWIGYYPSGKVSAKATFHNDEQRKAIFYNEDGSRNTQVKTFMAESEYPGGDPRWLYFLNKNLHYPDSAINHEIQGTVVIGFKVSKEGKASDFTVVQSVDKYLDAEALRVLKLSRGWQPAIYGGIYSDSYKRQPIIFKLE